MLPNFLPFQYGFISIYSFFQRIHPPISVDQLAGFDYDGGGDEQVDGDEGEREDGDGQAGRDGPPEEDGNMWAVDLVRPVRSSYPFF